VTRIVGEEEGHAAYCDWCHGTGRDPLWERKRELMWARLKKQRESNPSENITRMKVTRQK
jgi:hypothetical protein